ncbi:hypothetical protein BV898_15379 [Hypsibius exemplaris]|uniref:Uncharacterized protein n=1 Tax=Hypsibius exemplaris TaxID=2072580 RepID=A0A9X6NHQ1_HYPEX|nr:hypothetical protein BV898_15379 [Hypsibius exemplaris]
MFQINPLNVNRLLTEYNTDQFKDNARRISFQEQELANTLRDMIDRCPKHVGFAMKTSANLDDATELLDYEVSMDPIAKFVEEDDEEGQGKQNAVGFWSLFNSRN